MKRTMQYKVSAFSGLRILILHGASSQPDTLVNALHMMGISFVIQTADCESALNVLSSACRGFDIAFCDMNMKDMEGIEFICQAAQCDVGAFILMAEEKDELLSSAETIAHECGSPVLGVLAGAVEADYLKHLLLCYLDTASVAPGNEEGISQPQWTRNELVAALNRNQFVPFFQPKIDLDSGMPTCVEVLARWNHPEMGILPPSHFIELMEQQGLIDQLTGCLLMQSLSCAKECAVGGKDIGFAINVSPVTLQDARTPSRVGALVKECGLCPGRITIEVTETASSKSFAPVLASLTRLRMQGFEISMDDFGMGYSSLQLLSRMPFTELKIDRAFVSDVSRNPKSAAILESIIHLARKLHLRTVAEGIETNGELDFIRSLGCGSGQGFLLGRPMAQLDLIEYLEDAPQYAAA